MYAHVTTYRLGSQAEVELDVAASASRTGPVTDQTARTIASWWHSPAEACRNITSLSHGLPFDTVDLTEEIRREITDPRDAEALLEWVEHLEAHLSPGAYTPGTYADRSTGKACWSCAGLQTGAPGEGCIYPDAHRPDVTVPIPTPEDLAHRLRGLNLEES